MRQSIPGKSEELEGRREAGQKQRGETATYG
jgi:hypothetical protein